MSRCVVVDDDERLREALAEALSERGFDVRHAGSVAEARVLLREHPPDLLLLDVALPDGRASDVLSWVEKHCPTAQVVAMSGAAGPEESFGLAERGVRAYLTKPLRLDEVEAAVERALSSPADLTARLRSRVGMVPIRAVESDVRSTMVREALRREHGSRRGAARLLGISRQLLQHILRKN